MKFHRNLKSGLMALIACLLAGSAVYAAANVFYSSELESASRTTNATVVSDATASGASAVKFGTAGGSACATSTPNVQDGVNPDGGCWPGPASTGIAGCPALTRQTGDLRPGNGDVVENVLVDGGQVLINYNGANNITLRCVKVINYPYYFPIDVERPNTTSANHILFDHVEVDCGGSQVAHAAMLLQGVTVRNSRVYGCTDGFRFLDNVTIENSLCSNLRVIGDDNNDWHYDCSQSTGGNNVIIRGNYFKSRDTSDILLKSDLKAIDNVLVEKNLFDGDSDLGPSYLVYSVNGGYGTPTNVRFLNNRFTRNYTYGPCSFTSPYPTWTNNVWNDTGAVISTSAANCLD